MSLVVKKIIIAVNNCFFDLPSFSSFTLRISKKMQFKTFLLVYPGVGGISLVVLHGGNK